MDDTIIEIIYWDRAQGILMKKSKEELKSFTDKLLGLFFNVILKMKEFRFYPRKKDRKEKKYEKSNIVNLWMEEVEEKELQKKSKKKDLDSKKE